MESIEKQLNDIAAQQIENRKAAENEQAKKEPTSTKMKKEAFLNALRKSLGIILPAMQSANITSRQTIYNWRANDNKFRQAMDDCNEECLDVVESKLLTQIKEDNLTAIIFYLKTKGKHRGYTERQEITGADGEPIMKPLDIGLNMEEAQNFFKQLNNEI